MSLEVTRIRLRTSTVCKSGTVRGPKECPRENIRALPNNVVSCPHRVHIPNGASIDLYVLVRLTVVLWQTDRHTGRQTDTRTDHATTIGD